MLCQAKLMKFSSPVETESFKSIAPERKFTAILNQLETNESVRILRRNMSEKSILLEIIYNISHYKVCIHNVHI